MTSLWNKFVAWMRSKNLTTHTVGAAIVGFAVVYNSSPDVRNYIGTLLAGYPVVVTKIGIVTADIVAAVMLWAKYSHSSSAAGILANARSVNDSPNAPTLDKVNAADTKIQ